MSARSRTLTSLALAGAMALSGLAPALAETTPPSYTNAVSDSFADTWADPSVIQGKDGWWYSYATADPLRAGDAPTVGHIARTRDFVTWDYVGPIFTGANRPRYATATAGLWAPDVRYVQGRYVMYFSVTDTTLNEGVDNAVGVATAPTPAGPWTPTDEPVVAPRAHNPGDYFWTIDPTGFTDTDGNQYLYWGSYYGGVHVTRVSADGLSPVGESRQVAHWDRYEGSSVVEHDGWYYLMASSANCCAGPATGYSVFAGRSRSPMGPFLDADGLDLNASVTGGTTVVTQNGNTWVGAGHNAMLTDAEGRDFLVYHAIDKDQPWLTEPFGINRRPMLLDRIDWVDGWPRVNAGSGPSDTPMAAPVTSSLASATPWQPADGLSRSRAVTDPQGGTSARINGTSSTSVLPGGDLRLRLDLRSDEPTQVFLGQGRDQVKVRLDPAAGTLSLQVRGTTTTDSLKAMPAWKSLVIEVDRGRISAQVSEEDLSDPAAVVRTNLPGFTLPSAQARIIGNGLVDNLTVARPAIEAARLAPQPSPASTLFSDQFNGSLGTGWQWLRPQADVTTDATSLRWPLKSVDLTGKGGTGALLLREAPAGDWIAETKLTLDLGEGSNDRNYQQAGLVVHNTDDDFARLGTVSIWGTRTVEYGREMAGAPDGRLIYGGAIIGANAPTMWMRIAHHQAVNGEHLYRAAISRDGKNWVWGATWTLAAGTTPRIGLYAGGGATPAATASFDWFTISSANAPQGSWPVSR
ncbi:family 43 glycosylhydrolase [Luteococcus peritonei]|uniref:Family 43 glycosylhydrolase n=1 Tax=Luteococcus peritonei TaxID=88874 RepID=A0ABW4RS90_9ACTN